MQAVGGGALGVPACGGPMTGAVWLGVVRVVWASGPDRGLTSRSTPLGNLASHHARALRLALTFWLVKDAGPRRSKPLHQAHWVLQPAHTPQRTQRALRYVDGMTGWIRRALEPLAFMPQPARPFPRQPAH